MRENKTISTILLGVAWLDKYNELNGTKVTIDMFFSVEVHSSFGSVHLQGTCDRYPELLTFCTEENIVEGEEGWYRLREEKITIVITKF